jgi:hypothetical protein
MVGKLKPAGLPWKQNELTGCRFEVFDPLQPAIH